MGDCKYSDFINPSSSTLNSAVDGEGGTAVKTKKRVIGVKSGSQYKSSRFGIVFITLIKNIGEIMGVSNNLSAFFEFTK